MSESICLPREVTVYSLSDLDITCVYYNIYIYIIWFLCFFGNACEYFFFQTRVYVSIGILVDCSAEGIGLYVHSQVFSVWLLKPIPTGSMYRYIYLHVP